MTCHAQWKVPVLRYGMPRGLSGATRGRKIHGPVVAPCCTIDCLFVAEKDVWPGDFALPQLRFFRGVSDARENGRGGRAARVFAMAPMSILYAEDDEAVALLFRRVFAKASLEQAVHCVPDGRAAIAYLSGEGVYSNRERYPLPGLVLMDLNMPHVSGFELIRWIRAHADFANLPLIMLTSSAEQSDINTAFALGANGYVTKPSTIDKTLAVFGDLIAVCQQNEFNADGWLSFPGNQPKPLSRERV